MNADTIESIAGSGIALRGNDIDTDRIIPARYLRCVTFDGLGAHAFEDDRRHDPDHVFNDNRFRDASVLLVNKNFGCGSSREHAPQSLQRWGIRAIVGESFAEIFFGNCLAMGIPCVRAAQDDIQQLMRHVESAPEATLTVDVRQAAVNVDTLVVNCELPSGAQQALLEGTWNATAVLAAVTEKIDATAAALPYVNRFSA